MLAEFKFHHLGIAVFDIPVTAEYYINAGYCKTDNAIDPIQNVQICFLEKEGMPKIELLAAVDDNSPVNRVLKTVGVSPYHTCYSVSNLDQAIMRLKKMHFILVSKPSAACALDNKKVCFLFNKNIGLIELLEDNTI